MNKKAFIPISALMGALLLALVAAMTPFVADPDVAYAQSADATLSNLTIVGEPGDVNANLSPNFGGAVESYTARIPFITAGVTVTATANDATNATVSFSHADTDMSESGQQINLASRAGMTTDIVVTVRAQAGNTKRYTISVYRERETLNDDANLSSLSISPSGGLKESSTSTSAAPMYEARVQSGKVTVSYNLSDSAGGASAVVAAGSGTTIDDPAKPREITLTNEGAVGIFTVTVTPESGTGDNKVYTINVYRIRANRAIDATLDTLTLTPIPGTPTLVDDIALGTEDFVARAANATTHVTVVANTMDIGAVRVISPADADGNESGHQVSLTAGAVTTITVRVTAEDPSSRKTYTVKVYRNRSTLSTEARLSSLSVSDGSLDPAFRRTVNSYDVRVGHDVGKVTVSCATVDTAGAASVAVVTAPVQTDTTKNECGEEFTLDAAGATTTITVTVTAEDATTTNPYTITVYRVRSLPSADARLSALTLTPCSWYPCSC